MTGDVYRPAKVLIRYKGRPRESVTPASVSIRILYKVSHDVNRQSSSPLRAFYFRPSSCRPS